MALKGIAPTTLASQRRLTAAQFKSFLRGELEWIILKAVEKDRSRRYESCAALAADIQRYQNREPVEAGPPSIGYRCRKFFQRHRASSLGAAAVAIALLAGTIIALLGMLPTQAAKQEALRTVYLADMHVAHQALDERNFSLATRLLDRHSEKPADHDPRHFEWHVLKLRCQGNTERIFEAPGSAESISVGPSGKWVADGREGRIDVWEIATGERRTLFQSEDDTNKLLDAEVAFAPDGSALYGNIGDGVIRRWLLPDFEPTSLAIKIADMGAPEMFVSLDGKELIVRGEHVDVWNVVTGKLARRHETQSNTGRIALSPDGRRLAVGWWKTTILDFATFEGIGASDASGRYELAFSPDGTLLASSTKAYNGSDFTVHRITDGTQVARRNGHFHKLTGLAYSSDGRYLASASSDQTVVLWDANTYEELATLHGANKQIGEIEFTPDSKRILACSHNGRVCVWSIEECLAIAQRWPISRTAAVGHRGWFRQYSQISVSSDGKMIAATRGKHTGVALRSHETLEEQRLLADDGIACGVRFSPTGNLLAVGNLSGELRIYDSTDELTRVEVDRKTAEVFPVRFSSDGQRLLVVSRFEDEQGENVRAIVHDVIKATEISRWTLPHPDHCATISPDGRHVVSGHVDGI